MLYSLNYKEDVMEDKNKFLEICRAPGEDDTIMTGIVCPNCWEYYAFGTYFILDSSERVLVSAETTQCVSCGIGGLPAPHLFDSKKDAVAHVELYMNDDSISWFLDQELVIFVNFSVFSFLNEVNGLNPTV